MAEILLRRAALYRRAQHGDLPCHHWHDGGRSRNEAAVPALGGAIAMLTLNSRNVMLSGLPKDKRSVVLRVRRGGPEPLALGPNEALLVDAGTAIAPGQTVLALERDAAATSSAASRIIVPNELDYLVDGDVLAVE